MISIFSLPTKVITGAGAAEQLKAELVSRDVTRPLLVTGPVLFRDAVFRRIRASISDAEIFDEVDRNPSEKNVLDGAEHFVSTACDGIVAVGGGSVLDAAKAIRLKIHHPLPLGDYESGGPGATRITAEMPPLFTLPTTAGTGSEVSGSALIRIGRAGRKVRISNARLMPDAAIVDPELTLDLPLDVTVSSGFTAWTHNVEVACYPGYHPVFNAMAAEGLRLASTGLERLLVNPRNIEARRDMMLAALTGAIACQQGAPGIASALAHALATSPVRPHGVLLAALLPRVLEGLLSQAAGQIEDFGRKAGITGLAAASTDLAARCGVSLRLREHGVEHHDMEKAAQDAFNALGGASAPWPVTPNSLLAACQRAW